ncbi:putative ribonuclease H-like domain-containing protein [Tanacetum coccineum]
MTHPSPKRNMVPKAVLMRPKAVVNAARPKVVLNAVKGNHVNAVKASACWIQVSDGLGPQKRLIFLPYVKGNPQQDLQVKEVIDSGCSRHMTGNMSYLTDFEEIDGGYVAFGGNPKGGKIIGRVFEDLEFLDRVYKVEKALYRLHQAPRAWYETLSTYLLDNRFQRRKIDKTLFIKRDKGDILLVQVYVDDIIFGLTKKSLCTEFEKMMHKKF